MSLELEPADNIQHLGLRLHRQLLVGTAKIIPTYHFQLVGLHPAPVLLLARLARCLRVLGQLKMVLIRYHVAQPVKAVFLLRCAEERRALLCLHLSLLEQPGVAVCAANRLRWVFEKHYSNVLRVAEQRKPLEG